MTIQLSAAYADLLLKHTGTSTLDQILGGTLVLYNGTKPTTADTALSGNTVIATFTFDSTAADYSETGGVLNLKFGSNVTNPTVTAAATGNPTTFFRIFNSSAGVLMQGTVGTSGSDFNLSSTNITSGDNVSITGTPSISLPIT